MKLQKQLSRRVGETTYEKWIIVIPPSKIEKLGWKEGEELEGEVEENMLKIKPEANPSKKEEKMSYEEFRDRVKKVLESEPKGLTWTEIRKKANLYQKWPNNKWVRRMDRDIGLIREKIKGRTIWRLE